MIDCYQVPIRVDRNDHGGGLLLYFQAISLVKKVTINPAIEAIAIEINLKRKWILIGSYNPHKEMIKNHLKILLDDLCLKYENFIIIGDLNSEMHEDPMNIFCTTYNLKNLVKDPTCYTNIESPSCIDLILTNKPLYFQNTNVLETGISDFHKLTLTIMKSKFYKQKPKIFNYRNYKTFNNESFRNDVLYEISKGFHDVSCEEFKSLLLMILNKHAPMKTKYIRVNNSPFMNKELSKAIMVRSRLRNKSLKLKTEDARIAYKKQRNVCVSLLRKTKKNFYELLNPGLISDNKKFWKQVKPFFSDKPQNRGNIMLQEGKEVITNPATCEEIFNQFFVDVIKNLDIDRTLHTDTTVKNSNIIQVFSEYFKKDIKKKSFHSTPYLSQILNVINKIDPSKAFQIENIPLTILKENADMFNDSSC